MSMKKVSQKTTIEIESPLLDSEVQEEIRTAVKKAAEETRPEE